MAYAIFSSICLMALLTLGSGRIIVQDSLDNITISNPNGDNVSGELIGFKDYKYVCLTILPSLPLPAVQRQHDNRRTALLARFDR